MKAMKCVRCWGFRGSRGGGGGGRGRRWWKPRWSRGFVFSNPQAAGIWSHMCPCWFRIRSHLDLVSGVTTSRSLVSPQTQSEAFISVLFFYSNTIEGLKHNESQCCKGRTHFVQSLIWTCGFYIEGRRLKWCDTRMAVICLRVLFFFLG